MPGKNLKTTHEALVGQGFEYRNTDGEWYIKQGLRSPPHDATYPDIHISVNAVTVGKKNTLINTPHVSFYLPGDILGYHVYYHFQGGAGLQPTMAVYASLHIPDDIAIAADVLMRREVTGWGLALTPSGATTARDIALAAAAALARARAEEVLRAAEVAQMTEGGFTMVKKRR